MEEEAEEEPIKTLERCPKKRNREKRGEDLALTVVVESQEREEPAGRQNNKSEAQPELEMEQLRS